MGLSYECASSILLCSEDNRSIFGFDEEDAEMDLSDWTPLKQNCDLYGDFLLSFPLPTDECIASLLRREAEHLPRADYAKRLMNGSLYVSIRSDAIDWLLKVHGYYNFGPVSAYLSVNYLDRFLSSYELPQSQAWMTQLISVACLSLAAKVEETEVPVLLDLQVSEAKFVFEARTIKRMELLLLSTLKWRMHAVTPFSFVDYFLHELNGGNSPSRLLLSRSVELILCTIRGVKFLTFKPSEIAAATALSVMSEAQIFDVEKSVSCCCNVDKVSEIAATTALSVMREAQIFDVERSVSCCCNVDKVRLLSCYELIQEEILRSNNSGSNANLKSEPQSPVGVLDAARLSYKSDATNFALQPSSHRTSPAAKRRKLSTSVF